MAEIEEQVRAADELRALCERQSAEHALEERLARAMRRAGAVKHDVVEGDAKPDNGGARTARLFLHDVTPSWWKADTARGISDRARAALSALYEPGMCVSQIVIERSALSVWAPEWFAAHAVRVQLEGM